MRAKRVPHPRLGVCCSPRLLIIRRVVKSGMAKTVPAVPATPALLRSLGEDENPEWHTVFCSWVFRVAELWNLDSFLLSRFIKLNFKIGIHYFKCLFQRTTASRLAEKCTQLIAFSSVLQGEMYTCQAYLIMTSNFTLKPSLKPSHF